MKTKIFVISVVVCLLVLLSGCVEVQDETGNGEIESKFFLLWYHQHLKNAK